MRFNDCLISLTAGTYFISQLCHLLKLQLITTNATLQHIIPERAREAYLASVSRPDLTYGFAVCSQFRTPTATTITLLNNTIAHAHKHPSGRLQYQALGIATCHLTVFADASFVNNNDMSFQNGFTVSLIENTNTASVLHYSSIKAKCISCGAFAAELLGIAYAFDQRNTLQISINASLEREIHFRL